MAEDIGLLPVRPVHNTAGALPTGMLYWLPGMLPHAQQKCMIALTRTP